MGLYVSHGMLFGRWLIDDAGITFAYARSLASGYGFVVQPGAPVVEGYSNPLWLLLLLLGKLLHIFDSGTTVASIPDYVWFPKLLALFCFVGTLVCYQRAAQPVLGRRGSFFASALAGALLACTPSYVMWTVSGLENGLYGLTVAVQCSLLMRAVSEQQQLRPDVAVKAALLAFACALTRPDGLIYFATYPLIVAVLLHRSDLSRRLLVAAGYYGGTSLGVLASLFVTRWIIFHSWLPNTAVAKQQQPPTLAMLERVVELAEYVGWPHIVSVAFALGVMFSAGGPGTRTTALRRSLVALLISAALGSSAYAILNPDWMGELRFATPAWVCGSFLSSMAVVAVVGDRTRALWPRLLTSGAIVLTCVAAIPRMERRMAERAQMPTVSLCQVADEYRLFNLYGQTIGVPAGSLVLPDLGGSSLTLRHLLFDSAGLTDRAIALGYRNQDWRAVYDYILEEVRPTFIHKHGPWLPGIGAEPVFQRDYVAFNADLDYVARSALKGDESLLARLREQAPREYAAVKAFYQRYPRRACGRTLEPGSLPARRVLSGAL